MSRHRRRERGRQRSARLRALLGLGVVLGVGATGTFAFWTDEVTIAGTSFTAGTIDLHVNDSNGPVSTTLAMSAMVPGSSSAQVLTVKNNGTAPLKYAMTGGLTGTGAGDFNTAASLKLTVRLGGTAAAGACTGGTVIANAVALTSTPSATIVASRPTVALAAAATEALCFQVALDPTAPSSLQGKSAIATFTFTGTSDVS